MMTPNMIRLRCTIHRLASRFAQHCGKSKRKADIEAMRDYCIWLAAFEERFSGWAVMHRAADIYASLPVTLLNLDQVDMQGGRPCTVPRTVAHCISMAIQMILLDERKGADR